MYLASLNHPHIGAIYGLEDADDVRALVLELVHGETLADRIARGPIPVADALIIGRQIADALDAAHEKGIVHRDLKPANIKTTPDGVVKVLDFGLAKATSSDTPAADLTQSPTATFGGTREGIILGTPAYMSPEQARGQSVDKRTDIWAFGCVLYEVLTGRAAFPGTSVPDILAAWQLDREPDWSALPADTAVALRHLLRRCVEKDVRLRLRDIGDAPADALAADSRASVAGVRPPHEQSTARSRLPLRWAVSGLAALAFVAVSAAAFRAIGCQTLPQWLRSREWLIPDLPAGWRLSSDSRIAVSSDGTTLAFVAVRDLTSQIFLRRLDAIDAHPIDGTRGALHPFFSAWSGWRLSPTARCNA